jgi:hypothetical protein
MPAGSFYSALHQALQVAVLFCRMSSVMLDQRNACFLLHCRVQFKPQAHLSSPWPANRSNEVGNSSSRPMLARHAAHHLPRQHVHSCSHAPGQLLQTRPHHITPQAYLARRQQTQQQPYHSTTQSYPDISLAAAHSTLQQISRTSTQQQARQATTKAQQGTSAATPQAKLLQAMPKHRQANRQPRRITAWLTCRLVQRRR